jgi:putative CocE/NonD family hydrolase
MRRLIRSAPVLLLYLSVPFPGLVAQAPTGLSAEAKARRWALEHELDSLAIIDRKVMLPMRDGMRLATDIYRPRDASRKYPVIFSKTPYNFNYWDVRNGVPSDLTAALTAIKRGYAYVVQNERGHFFSEGNYDILGPPRTDGYDAIKWMAEQPWSNGKVGLIGCSSTAEWQMGVAALAPPGLGTIIPQGFGAGVGRVAPYFEQGNWYRGGAVQMLFIAWLSGEQNQVRPAFAKDATQQELIEASRRFDTCRKWTSCGRREGPRASSPIRCRCRPAAA